MALSDRALPKALVAAYNNSGSWKDYVSNSSITAAGTDIDPIVSGSSFANYLPAGGAVTITVNTPLLTSLMEFTMELYCHFDRAASGVILKAGSTTVIEYNSSGYFVITPPYVGATPVNIDHVPFDASQISILCSREGYSICVNGVKLYSGVETGAYLSTSTAVFDSSATLAKTFGAFLMFGEVSSMVDVENRLIDAFGRSDAQYQYFDSETANVVERSQVFQTVYNMPGHQSWEDFYSPSLGRSKAGIGLKLDVFEEYCEYGCYRVPDLGSVAQMSGSIHVRIPSYSTNPGTRGVIHLRPKNGEGDHHTIIIANNQPQYIRRDYSYDASGVETSSNSTPQSIGTTLSGAGGSEVFLGFVWDSTGLRVVRGGSAVAMTELSSYMFSPYGYEAYIGVDGSLANPYHASKGAWDWELRVWNYADESLIATDYGTHTFFMNGTGDMPVRAEGNFIVEVPIWYSSSSGAEKVKTPSIWYEGSAAVTGELI